MLCNDLQRIGGRRRFEKFANDTPRNGPVAVRLIQGLQILMIASLAHSLINSRKFLMRGLMWQLWQQNREKSDFLNKINAIFFLFAAGHGS